MARIMKSEKSDLCHICGHFEKVLAKVEYPMNVLDLSSEVKTIRICANCITIMTGAVLDGVTKDTPPAPPILAIVNSEPMYKK